MKACRWLEKLKLAVTTPLVFTGHSQNITLISANNKFYCSVIHVFQKQVTRACTNRTPNSTKKIPSLARKTTYVTGCQKWQTNDHKNDTDKGTTPVRIII